MPKISNSQNTAISEKQIDLVEIYKIIFQRKWFVILLALIFSTTSLIFSYSLPNLYKSSALLASSASNSASRGFLNNFNKLSDFTGINIPTQSSNSNADKAFETLTSASFFEENIFPYIFLPDLMAIKSWNHQSNSMVYDETIFDISSKKWIREFSYPQHQIPSAQESYDVFMKNFILERDAASGFIKLSYTHQSPFIAKQWIQLIIEKINLYYRNKDKLESEAALAYLEQQMLKTNYTEIKQAIAELIQLETQKLALIEVSDRYVFDFIVTPIIPEKPSQPNRLLIILSGLFIGTAFAISIVLIRSRNLP